MHDFPRVHRLPPYVFAQVNELKMHMRRQGEDIIDLGMGNPDLPTPDHIVDKLCEAARKPTNHRYSASKGIKGLRLAIANWYLRRFGVELDPDLEVVATMGAKEGLSHLALVMLAPGDVVFTTDPAYPIHPYAAIIAGADVRRIPISKDRDFFADLNLAHRQTWPQPKLLIISFPHNPTTLIAEPDFFERVIAYAKANNVLVIHDFAYADFTYDGYVAPSFLATKGAKDVGVEFFSLTKSYSMAGWRVGFCCGNKEMVQALTRIKSYLDYGIFQPIQIAATVALNGPQECVRQIMDVHQDRRDALIEGLERIGWKVPAPKATMFVWAEIPDEFKHMGSVEFAKHCLIKGNVAVSPGLGFGSYGDTHVRFALVENRHRINQAVRGLKRVLGG